MRKVLRRSMVFPFFSPFIAFIIPRWNINYRRANSAAFFLMYPNRLAFPLLLLAWKRRKKLLENWNLSKQHENFFCSLSHSLDVDKKLETFISHSTEHTEREDNLFWKWFICIWMGSDECCLSSRLRLSLTHSPRPDFLGGPRSRPTPFAVSQMRRRWAATTTFWENDFSPTKRRSSHGKLNYSKLLFCAPLHLRRVCSFGVSFVFSARRELHEKLIHSSSSRDWIRRVNSPRFSFLFSLSTWEQ